MNKADAKRQAVVEKLADHLLAHGMPGASLRPLAAAAGLSDRMLLYYFADKNELMAAALSLIAQRLLAILDSARGKPMPFHLLLPHLAKLMGDPALLPYTKLWLELVAAAARGDQTIQAIACQIGDGFLQWVATALKVKNEADRLPQAALLLATVDGLSLLDAIGSTTITQAARMGISLQSRAWS